MSATNRCFRSYLTSPLSKDETRHGCLSHPQHPQLNQLNVPTYLFIDRQETVYVSDLKNHRVVKWMKGAEEGIVVAGGHDQGNSLKQLYQHPSLFLKSVTDLMLLLY